MTVDVIWLDASSSCPDFPAIKDYKLELQAYNLCSLELVF